MRIFLLPSLQLAFFLSKVRDWKAIVPDNVTFKNAFRARKWLGNEDHHVPLPQSFTYMARAGGREIQNKKNLFESVFGVILVGTPPCFLLSTRPSKSRERTWVKWTYPKSYEGWFWIGWCVCNGQRKNGRWYFEPATTTSSSREYASTKQKPVECCKQFSLPPWDRSSWKGKARWTADA